MTSSPRPARLDLGQEMSVDQRWSSSVVRTSAFPRALACVGRRPCMPAIRRPKGHPPWHTPHTLRTASRRPSDRTALPVDVTDRLLWALAVDVAAAHHPGPDGACTNLQCRGQQRSLLGAAHRPARRTTRPPRRHPRPAAFAAGPAAIARGRAPVPAMPRRLTGWFSPGPSAGTCDAACVRTGRGAAGIPAGPAPTRGGVGRLSTHPGGKP